MSDFSRRSILKWLHPEALSFRHLNPLQNCWPFAFKWLHGGRFHRTLLQSNVNPLCTVCTNLPSVFFPFSPAFWLSRSSIQATWEKPSPYQWTESSLKWSIARRGDCVQRLKNDMESRVYNLKSQWQFLPNFLWFEMRSLCAYESVSHLRHEDLAATFPVTLKSATIKWQRYKLLSTFS